MKLSRASVTKIENFLEKIQNQIYPEPPDSGHEEIMRRMIDLLMQNSCIAPGGQILDVGCGRGIALGKALTNPPDVSSRKTTTSTAAASHRATTSLTRSTAPWRP